MGIVRGCLTDKTASIDYAVEHGWSRIHILFARWHVRSL